MTKEEFDSQRGGEEEPTPTPSAPPAGGGRESEETEGDMVFPLDLQDGAEPKRETEVPPKSTPLQHDDDKRREFHKTQRIYF